MALARIDLPERPLLLKGNLILTKTATYFGLPLFLCVIGAFLYWYGPDLQRDYEIRKNPVVVDNGRLQDGECSTYRGFFTNCKATLSYSYGGKRYESHSEIFFIDLHLGDYESDVVIAADHPEKATLGLGIEKYWDRVLSLGGLLLVFAFLGLVSTYINIRHAIARARLRKPGILTPLAVDILSYDRKMKRYLVTYRDPKAKWKSEQTLTTRFAKGQQPLMQVDGDGEVFGIAVHHAATNFPVLLDSGLERLELTDEERASALGSLPPGQAVSFENAMSRTKRQMSFLRATGYFILFALLLVAAGLGYWLWYVTNAHSQFNRIGMEINNLMPKHVNDWGCRQLKKRFGADRAPYGCTAEDFVSWRV